MASLYIIIPCAALMVLGSLTIPLEHATVINQVTTTGRLYLPHIDADMDDYHYYADPDGDQSKRVLLTFCKDKGFAPQFNEGETLKWMRYRAWPNCLELLGVAAVRDQNHNAITR